MEQIQESQFLGKEQVYLDQYQEEEADQEAAEAGLDGAGAEQEDDVERQVFESFVKQKHAILNYVYDLILFAAKLHDIAKEKIFSEGAQLKRAEAISSKIASDRDSFNIKNRVSQILLKYQEASYVLDPLIGDMVEPIMKMMQIYTKQACSTGSYAVPKEVSLLFEILYNLCNVRGFKTIVKFFPHEAADMEPCVELLHFQDQKEYWIDCMLALWLSIIVIVPFDIQTIDSKKAGDSYEILVKRMVNIGKQHIQNSGKIRDYCSIMLSKLLTRPDVIKQGETKAFLVEMANLYAKSKEDTSQMFSVSGILQTLVEIFKIGHREDFLGLIDIVFEPILQSEVKNKFMAKSTIIRKNRVKLAQRIGCIFLKPRVAAWRYQRGSRTLNHLAQEAQATSKEVQEVDEEMLEEEDVDFEKLEHIIQLLLESLKDEDNVVRWTSAKGLGRITQRLTKDFADQVVEQLPELFKETETDSSWHGGCLALAELCRRGLLLPERLECYVKVLDKALIYDVNRGTHTVGSHVRDAACYAVWSFARAYSPEIMKPHVHTLSTKLIIVSLFDREVNCRRAASATFQECVGRQGNFPHGIEILTEADYFTLSHRTNAYLNVSTFVGQFPEYLESMLEHLAFVKLQHPDLAIRMLAAQALSVLSVFNPKLVVEKILAPLTEKCLSKALHIRHGAILGVSEIVIGLGGNSVSNRKETLEKAWISLSLKERKLIKDSENQAKFKELFEKTSSQNYLNEVLPEGSEMLTNVITIIQRVEKERLYKGKGGEIMRGGVCHLIHALATSKLKLDDSVLHQLVKTLIENFKHPNPEIQDEATKAFKTFCFAYLNDGSPSLAASSPIILDIKKLFDPSMNDMNIAITRGYNMAFGVMTQALLLFFGKRVTETVLANCVPKNRESDDAESRRQSVRSLIQIVEALSIEKLSAEERMAILETFYKGFEDYAVDRRGDVGSWVRQEAMVSLNRYIFILNSTKDSSIKAELGADKPEFYEKFIAANLQQLNEKIDRIREQAGKTLQKFFKFTAPLIQDVQFCERDKLTALFLSEDVYMDESQIASGDAKLQNAEIAEQESPQQDQESPNLLTDSAANDGIAYLPWRSAQFVFNSIKPFFDSEVYSIPILKGLITSSGGLTESTLKASQTSLFEHLSEMSKVKGPGDSIDKAAGIAQKRNFLKKLVKIHTANLKTDRVTVPLMKTIEMLLTADYLSEAEIQEDIHEIHSLAVSECNKSKNITKLIAGIGVFAGLVNSVDAELCKKGIKTLLFLLYHNFPKVRSMAAEKLYTGVLTMEEYEAVIPGGEDAYEAVQALLSETDWSHDAKTLAAQTKVEMYGFFGYETQLKPAEEVKRKELEAKK